MRNTSTYNKKKEINYLNTDLNITNPYCINVKSHYRNEKKKKL